MKRTSSKLRVVEGSAKSPPKAHRSCALCHARDGLAWVVWYVAPRAPIYGKWVGAWLCVEHRQHDMPTLAARLEKA